MMGLADNMTCYKCEILCDIETDLSKKMRAFMTDEAGQKYMLTRTIGKSFFVECKCLDEQVAP
jgi:hypothetical protein